MREKKLHNNNKGGAALRFVFSLSLRGNSTLNPSPQIPQSELLGFLASWEIMTTKAFILANVLHFEIRQAEESGWSFGEVCKFCGWLPKLKWNCCYSLSLSLSPELRNVTDMADISV